MFRIKLKITLFSYTRMEASVESFIPSVRTEAILCFIQTIQQYFLYYLIDWYSK